MIMAIEQPESNLRMQRHAYARFPAMRGLPFVMWTISPRLRAS